MQTETQVPHPVIAHGRHAGQPRPLDDIILDRLSAIKAAVLALRARGHHTIAVHHIDEGIAPTVVIENSARCAGLAGNVVKWATDDIGPYRVFETRLDDVRVRWIERGH